MEEVDEDFEKELAALMTDFKLPPSGPFPQAVSDPIADSRQDGAGSTVSFRVTMKRGGRDDRSKAVQVRPCWCSTCGMVLTLRTISSLAHIPVTADSNVTVYVLRRRNVKLLL